MLMTTTQETTLIFLSIILLLIVLSLVIKSVKDERPSDLDIVLFIIIVLFYTVPIATLTFVLTNKMVVKSTIERNTVYIIETDEDVFNSSKAVIPTKINGYYHFSYMGKPIKTQSFRILYTVPGSPPIDSTRYYVKNIVIIGDPKN